MSNLLQVAKFNTKVMKKKGALPLMVEFNVAPESAPFLVTSSQAVVWVEEAHPGDLVKAAVRVATPGDLFTEIIRAVARRGLADQWGNVHPFTLKGLEAAMQHLQSYDFHELEILAAPVKKQSSRPAWLRALPVRPASWVPTKWVVVVPKDREYVGLIGHLDPKHLVSVVHNASRGMAIIRTGL